MNGDPGLIADHILNFFGGPGGAKIAGAAVLVCWLFAGIKWLSPHHAWITSGCVVGAWTAAFVVSRLIGWGT